MWLLQGASEEDTGKVHFLVCGQVLEVGRRDGHILLSTDVTISRKHAAFTLTFPPEYLKTRRAAVVELRDLNSKSGTYINDNIKNGKRLAPGATQELHHGDLIRFGLKTNTWRLEHQDLTVATSTLKSEGRQQLLSALMTLGGHLHSDWSSDCCYLVMPAITLTVKVACALASGRNIVLPEFFTKLADAIIHKSAHPNPAQFLPPVLESKISSAGASLTPDPRRSTIFAGLTFLFASEAQKTNLCSSVQLAGGKAELLSEDNYQQVVSGRSVLISLATESQQTDTLYSRTCDLLKRHGLRAVPQSEIGLAIVFVSTEGHCNSSFKDSDIFKKLRKPSNTSQPSEKLKIFATETQESEISISLTGRKVIPDSGVPQASTSGQSAARPPSKRPLITIDDDGGKAKRSNKVPSPDITQPLSTMDLCEDDMEEDDIKVEVHENTFKPRHTSTQRDDPPHSTPVDQSATASFAPYTLPSLKTLEPEEKEEVTQPYCPDNNLRGNLLGGEERSVKLSKDEIKVEPVCENDLKFDEWWKKDKAEEDLGRKRGRSEAVSPQAHETKKIKTSSSTSKDKLINNNGFDNNNDGSSKRKGGDNDEALFTLPRRLRRNERTEESLTCKPATDSDLFTLPTRTYRPRRPPADQDSLLLPPTLPTPIQETPAIPPTPESEPIKASVKETAISSKFIDREETTSLKDTDSTGEISVSHTLVVVESMVMQAPSRRQPPSAKIHDSSRLPNFKVFKKVNATCIPKLIGGSDFVEHDMTAASQEFKIDITVSKSNQSLQCRQPSFDEQLFDLGGIDRKRR